MNAKANFLYVPVFMVLGTATPAPADDASAAAASSVEIEARHLDRDVAGRGPARVQSSISTDFSEWAGSPGNANALVTGLREGRQVTLTADPSAPSGAAGSVTFTPPTRPMGYGNVYISLALARAQLAAQGIASPTPLQLQTALMGGGTDQTRGVLQLRSDGMGWGRIAQAYDLKLGPVIADLKSAHQSLSPTRPAPAAPNQPGASSRTVTGSSRAMESRGIVTAAGTPAATFGERGLATAGGDGHVNTGFSNSGTRGIVNAGGAGAGPGIGQARGRFK